MTSNPKKEQTDMREFFEMLTNDADVKFEAAISKAVKQEGRIKYQKQIVLKESTEGKWQSIGTLSLLEMDFKQLKNAIK